MYGLHESTSANLLDFVGFYLIQNALPAVMIVATPKQSPIRLLAIGAMILIASRFIRPFAPAGSPAWCQAICQLVLVSIQATHLLLIRPLDRWDIANAFRGSQSIISHMYNAMRALIQTRGVDTPWQVKNVPSHSKYYQRRGMDTPQRVQFITRQALILAWQYLALDITQAASIQSSLSQQSLNVKPEWNIPLSKWAERGTTHLAIWFVVNRLIGDSAYRLLSILFVGLGIDDPSNWPPAFGSVVDCYTLRNFWGKFWHQFMRQPFTSLSKFVARDILGLPFPSVLERYMNLFLVFLFSSMFHVIVDLLQSVPIEHSGSIPFFMTFVIGIVVEDAIQELWQRLLPSDAQSDSAKTPFPPLWQRIIGYTWVMVWLAITSTWYFTPMIALTGQDITMVPFSFAGKFGLFPIVGLSVISGMIIAYVYEVEL
ncbi:hypothetical protein N7532_001970 [Penicillium argentinense]|uniref:Wax synthase domain-containing protein n=1 Tax=Penicillium argentinense TaxID=1131581 RepID=A0A9W9KMA6_9EURO|nr:uncharacterized protein N7532_001970 [Penicillium argentinense]KAJ5111435.1 hypothetical protein N7532_001970 [Penicillium argentinense]